MWPLMVDPRCLSKVTQGRTSTAEAKELAALRGVSILLDGVTKRRGDPRRRRRPRAAPA
jgi:hypothetical protein